MSAVSWTAHISLAGALLLWFKATSTIFPPSAVLSVLMAQAVAGGAAASTFSGWSSSLSYVAFPWLTGHALLWASAYMVCKFSIRSIPCISSPACSEGARGLSTRSGATRGLAQ